MAMAHVSFGYGKREILHDVTFTAPQGLTTAIVGPSGSGKSTICNLVARFYDADSGTVSVGGHDVREFTCESLLRNISMVFSECVSLPGQRGKQHQISAVPRRPTNRW